MTASRIGAVVLGLVGVLVILRPGMETFRPAALLVLGAALAFAITLIATKKLTRTDSTFAIIFWMNLIQLPLALIGSDPLFLTKLGLGQVPALDRRSALPGSPRTIAWPMRSGPAMRAWWCRSISCAFP